MENRREKIENPFSILYPPFSFLKMIRSYRLILFVGIIEVLIGFVTLLFNLLTLIAGTNTKSFGVLVFVIIASCASTTIGIGLLKFNKLAYQVLLYFASVIVLSKILILLGLIQLNGELEVSVPSHVKSFVSIAYHGFLILYLRKSDVQRNFHV
jgi:hypothetical protein